MMSPRIWTFLERIQKSIFLYCLFMLFLNTVILVIAGTIHFKNPDSHLGLGAVYGNVIWSYWFYRRGYKWVTAAVIICSLVSIFVVCGVSFVQTLVPIGWWFGNICLLDNGVGKIILYLSGIYHCAALLSWTCIWLFGGKNAATEVHQGSFSHKRNS